MNRYPCDLSLSLSTRATIVAIGLAGWLAGVVAMAQEPAEAEHPLAFIHTAFENASPVNWEIRDDGTVDVFLLYDYERASPNRAAGHWHFRVEGREGARITLVLNNLLNVWNRRPGSVAREETISFVSVDGRSWRPVEMELLEGHRLQLELTMEAEAMYVARLEPYRLSDLDRFLEANGGDPLVEITTIGETVEGRPLEIVRVGCDDAPHRIVIRCRAHPWEPGGNWVVEGLVERLLAGDGDAQGYLDRYALYIMPIANKDGVARGMTRFNVEGMDLNRNWDQPADPCRAPENAALEEWIESMHAAGRRIDLLIDFHNDDYGALHISRPEGDIEAYLSLMARYEALLREHTWFTEGSTGSGFRNPGSIGEGLLERYGIAACVQELNANWIAGLDDFPSAALWHTFGEQLAEVYYRLFASEE